MSGKRLKGKKIIVTGAGSSPGEGIGNGKAAAVLYSREGADVMLVDVRAEAAEETDDIIKKEGGRSFVFKADVTDSTSCQAMLDLCLETYGRVDILHNNVGIGQIRYGGPPDVKEEEWQRLIDINLKSMFLTCRAVLPQMIKQKTGSILNISSIGAVWYGLPNFIYSISKAGVNTLTRSLAVQYADKGIRVNAIMPGLIETPLIDKLKILYDGDREKMNKERAKSVPMKRVGDAWDIAYAALFLVSDEAKYITGQVLAVDGGITCSRG